jgi:pilus assembly protein CpaE
MVEVRNNGVPLIEQAPKAPITQSIIQLAEALAGEPKVAEEVEAAKSGKYSWLGFLGGKSKS